MKDNHKLLDTILDHLNVVLLYGPPGTGKTYMALEALRERFDIVLRAPITPGTTREDLVSQCVGIQDGSTVWSDGPLTVAAKNPAGLIIDEVGQANDEVLAILLPYLDTTEPGLLLPDGTYLPRHEQTKIILTSNEPPNSLPNAIQDRLGAALPILQAPQTIALPDNIKKALASPADPSADWAWTPAPSIRRAVTFVKLHKVLNDEDLAAQIAFGDAGRDWLHSLHLAELGD